MENIILTNNKINNHQFRDNNGFLEQKFKEMNNDLINIYESSYSEEIDNSEKSILFLKIFKK